MIQLKHVYIPKEKNARSLIEMFNEKKYKNEVKNDIKCYLEKLNERLDKCNSLLTKEEKEVIPVLRKVYNKNF